MNYVMSFGNDPSSERLAAHPTDVQLQNYARARRESVHFDSEVDAHLMQCLICRIHVGRLSVEGRDSADPAFLAALTSESPQIDSALRDALSASPTAIGSTEVRVGQLWRAARSATGSVAVLVWIRKVFDSTVAVLPAALDVELADAETLIVSADQSPLNLPLAVFSNIDAEIDIASLTTLISDLDIADDINALRVASRDGVPPPSHVTTGLPVAREDDQRIEYRQILSELVDSLYTENQPAVDDEIDPHDLFAILEDLSIMQPGLRVHSLPFDDVVYVDARHMLHPVAAVHHLATCVVVTAVDGPNAMGALTNPALPGACGEILSRFLEADSIAVCAPDSDWQTVLLAPMDMQPAIEVPAGHQQPASVYGRPLDLNTMLLKHFDGTQDRWSDTSSVHFHELSAGLRNVEATSPAIAESAVSETRQKGKRATIPAKKEGYSRLSDDAASRISDLINEVLAGEDGLTVLDDFLDGQS